MERLMALYNTASPSGREKSMIRLLKAELTGITYSGAYPFTFRQLIRV